MRDGAVIQKSLGFYGGQDNQVYEPEDSSCDATIWGLTEDGWSTFQDSGSMTDCNGTPYSVIQVNVKIKASKSRWMAIIHSRITKTK